MQGMDVHVRGFCNESHLVSSGYYGDEPEFMVAACISGNDAQQACGADTCVQIYEGKSRLECVEERLLDARHSYPVEAGRCHNSNSRYPSGSTIYTCQGGVATPPARTLNAITAFDEGGGVNYYSDLNCEVLADDGPDKEKHQDIAPLTSCAKGASPSAPILGFGCINERDAPTWCDADQCAVVCTFNTTGDCMAGTGSNQTADGAAV